MSVAVLVVDGGGRGAVLVEKYAQSPQVDRILAVPGNDWMSINTDKEVRTFPDLQTNNVEGIVSLCIKERVALVDVAQDRAIACGLVDALDQRGVLAVGPSRLAGQIEWDKAWARSFMRRRGIAHPRFAVFDTPAEGIRYLHAQPDGRWFVKASGLADGKGALPAEDREEAVRRIAEIEQFGEAATIFLLEQWADGEEFSTFALCDGERFQVIGSAQDHKRLHTFDEGPNTGGMGCSTPPLVLTNELIESVERAILTPAIDGLLEEGRPYRGVLYLGGIVRTDGHLSVIEFNARWGDPEAQVIIPGLMGDFFTASLALAEGHAINGQLKSDGLSRVVVSGVARGYPGDYSTATGKRVFGLEDARRVPGVRVYGAGVKRVDGKDIAMGGRLFHVVGAGQDVMEARAHAYEALCLMSVEGNNLHYRTDIGWRDVERIRALPGAN